MEWMVLPYQRYADFSGRSRRKEYWMFQLLNMIVLFVLLIPLIAFAPDQASGDAGNSTLTMVFALVMVLYAFVSFIPGLAVTVRRLHDQNLSGWFYFLSVIPFVGGFILLYFMVMEGTRGDNHYGPDPKA